MRPEFEIKSIILFCGFLYAHAQYTIGCLADSIVAEPKRARRYSETRSRSNVKGAYIYIYILVIRKLDQRQTSKEHIYKYWKTPSWPWVDQRDEVYLGPVTLSDADLRWDSYIATEYHWPTRPARLSGSWWGAWRWVPWPSRTKESPAWLGRRLSSQAQSGTGRTRRRRR